MRRNRRVKLNLFSGDTAAVALLGVLFVLGGFCGCLAAGCVDGESGAALEEYLKAYLTLSQQGTVQVSLGAVLWDQVRFPLAVLLLSFTAIGVVGIPAVFGVRGFLFSFSVACFFRLFGWAGFGPAVFLFGVPALLWVPVLFVLGMQGMGSSYDVLRRCRGENCDPAFFRITYWHRCAVCVFALAACAALEYLILPACVGLAARFVL